VRGGFCVTVERRLGDDDQPGADRRPRQRARLVRVLNVVVPVDGVAITDGAGPTRIPDPAGHPSTR
jgi:hypothetical protein